MDKPVILCVDDDPAVLESLKIGLEDRGHQVLKAAGGAEALAILKSKKPDLMLLDLRMQPMSGFDLFQEVKKNPRFSTIPVLFLTAVNDPLAEKYGQSLGVDAYLTKPIDIDNLDGIIRSKLGI